MTIQDPHATAAPWWERIFADGSYLRLWSPHFTPERTEREVAGVLDLLQPTPGVAILDLACGQGRFAVPLAQRGYQVTGLDLSEQLLDVARGAADAAGVAAEWHRADMRDIPAEWAGRFDYIINIFTAFGYFEAEAENQRVLDGVARALKPGGRFLIELGNRDGVGGQFRERGWHETDGLLVCTEVSFDPIRGVSSTVWQWDEGGERQELRFSLRLYTPTELTAMLRAAGLEPVAAYDGLAGSELTHESQRMALVAEKPREQPRPAAADRPAESPWWPTFFDAAFLHLWPPSPTSEREPAEVESLVALLGLPPEGRVLDLACGYGRIAVPLARRGFQVTGLDLSEPLLAVARERAAQAGVTVEWRRADMRDPPAEWYGRFDAVISIWNSFGYFADDRENQRVLASAARALKSGGRLLIDVSNRDRVVSAYRARDWEERDGLVLLQARTFDPVRGRNRTALTWYEEGQRRQVAGQSGTTPPTIRAALAGQIDFTVRLYTPTELTRMVAAAGLRPVACCGDWTGAELTRDGWHIILTAEKP